MNAAGAYGYDLVPYAGPAAPSAHLRRLESIASLFGMTPAAPAAARVLELGCGTGANLLPLAVEYPQATIVGCDLAARAIACARDMAEALGTVNLELRHAGFADVDEGWGTFDYILCHDVFSWVAPEVQRTIMAIVAEHLAPNGVAYISYDALPGWHFHDVARAMMRYHTRHLAGPRQTIEQARAMLATAAQVQDQNSGAYAALVRDEYCTLSAVPDEQLYHVISEAHHRPFYFHEFLNEVNGANLQWLGDAGPDMFGRCLPEAAQLFLDRMPILERQPYIDFFSNCAFRRAVLCRKDVELCRRPAEEVFRRLWIGLSRGARLETSDVAGTIGVSVDGRALRTADPAINQALRHLDRARPEFVPFSVLFASDDRPSLDFMMDAWEAGAVDGVLTPFTLTNQIGEFPTVSPLVRLQIEYSGLVTNQKSEPVQLSALMRFVAGLLDGRHDRAALAEIIAREVESKRFGIDLQRVILNEAHDPSELTKECLRYFRDHALLIDRIKT